jgi:hypothetical protein
MPRWSTHWSAGLANANPKIAIGGAALVVVGIAGWITSEAVSAVAPEADTPSMISPDSTGTPKPPSH